MPMLGYRRTIARNRSARRRLWRRLSALAAAAAAVIAVSAAPALATTYSVTDLGNLGFQNTVGRAINNNGQVVGYSGTKKTVEGGCSLKFRPCPTHVTQAFLWEAGTMTDLGTLGGLYSEATAINNLGEVVGSSQTKSGPNESFLYQAGKKLIGLGTFGATAINDLGVIAGASPVPGPIPNESRSDAAILQNGKVTDLGSLPTVNVTVASAINNSNEVMGTGDNSESDLRAWVWHNGTLTDIGTLGGPQTAAYALNNAGQIVGFSQISTDADHGFVYQGGKMTDLGLNVFPYGINNHGVIVGSGGCGPAIIITDGVCQNLQNMLAAGSGVTLWEAKGINDNGQILASVNYTDYVLLTPQQ